jgi:type II secretion system protein J
MTRGNDFGSRISDLGSPDRRWSENSSSVNPQSAIRNPQSGFTLIELVVSMAVSVGIVAGAYLCLKCGIDSRKVCEQRMDIIQGARVALSLLAADLAAACVLTDDQEFVGMRRTRGEMDADNLDFATHNWRPRAPGEGDLCEISYFVDRSPKTGEVGLWRRRDPSPDSDPLSGGSREEIVPGIAGFRLEYYDGFEWYENWGMGGPKDRTSRNLSSYNLGGLPEAVRITLALKGPRSSPLAGGPSAGEGRGTAAGRAAEGAGSRRDDPSLLLFQTVVRLNLAARASEKYTRETGDSSTSSTQNGGSSADSGGQK